MKKLLLILICLFVSSEVKSESDDLKVKNDLKVKWEDSDGREFSIKVLSKEFDYTFIPGDELDYDRWDRVTKVGSIVIDYDRFDRVEKVGSLEIYYDRWDRIEKTIGRIK